MPTICFRKWNGKQNETKQNKTKQKNHQSCPRFTSDGVDKLLYDFIDVCYILTDDKVVPDCFDYISPADHS